TPRPVPSMNRLALRPRSADGASASAPASGEGDGTDGRANPGAVGPGVGSAGDPPGAAPPVAPAGSPGSTIGAGGILVLLALVLLAAAGWHITQGTSSVGMGDLLGLLTGEGTAVDDRTRDVLFGSRIPRLAAAITVGFALGVAGALFQSLARNSIASPDTLGVTAGAYFAVTAVAAFGVTEIGRAACRESGRSAVES